MEKKPLIGVSICTVVVLVLASLSNVVGYQTVQSSNQKTLDDMVDQKELVFQTIADIANNKEIQGILLRYQLSQGKFPVSDIPVVTMKQLKQMYGVGVILSKIISTARMHSMIEKYQLTNRGMQKEINAVIEKDTILKTEITQLSDSNCDCENENTIQWNFPILCTLLFPLMLVALILEFSLGLIFLGEIVYFFHELLNCLW